MVFTGGVKPLKISKEVRIIEIRFFNKQAKKEVKQCLVKIPKKIVDRLGITKKNKIFFDIREDAAKKPYLHMELR